MILFIDDMKTIGELQDKFNECFPYLQLRFLDQHATKTHPDLHPSTLIEEIRSGHKQGTLELKSWYTIARVEHDFKSLFGLNVQVLRREKNHWVMADEKERLSLHDQSEKAKTSLLQMQHRMIREDEEEGY